ncbi:hypothetical protein BH18ACT14_BH18ACT14_13610 [soil metagenome]
MGEPGPPLSRGRRTRFCRKDRLSPGSPSCLFQRTCSFNRSTASCVAGQLADLRTGAGRQADQGRRGAVERPVALISFHASASASSRTRTAVEIRSRRTSRSARESGFLTAAAMSTSPLLIRCAWPAPRLVPDSRDNPMPQGAATPRLLRRRNCRTAAAIPGARKPSTHCLLGHASPRSARTRANPQRGMDRLLRFPLAAVAPHELPHAERVSLTLVKNGQPSRP